MLSFKIFLLKFRINLVFQLKFYAMTMHESMSLPFQEFMASQGIIHQFSCAYIPQQNGVAKRKNRHLIETAWTMLIHHNVPLHSWGDAVLTACYLINRMPSFCKIRILILFCSQVNHLTLSLHVCLGALIFAHNHTLGKNKPHPKSIVSS